MKYSVMLTSINRGGGVKRRLLSLLIVSLLLGVPLNVTALDFEDPYIVTTTSGSNGFGNPFISNDGRYVAFNSDSPYVLPNETNSGTNAFRRDLLTGQIVRVNPIVGQNGEDYSHKGGTVLGLSHDGSMVLFVTNAPFDQWDTNNTTDLYVKNMNENTMQRISVNCAMYCSNVFGTSDLHLIMYNSNPFNGVEPVHYLYNLQTGVTSLLPDLPREGVVNPRAISDDGRFIAYEDNYPINNGPYTYRQNDIKLYDTENDKSILVNVALNGEQADNSRSEDISISDDGRFVTFTSYASNLVADDTNGKADIFTRDTLLETTERDSISSTGMEGNSHSMFPQISNDGKYVLFASGSNLTNASTTSTRTYIRDRVNHLTRLATPIDYPGQNGGFFGGRISADDSHVVFGTATALIVRSMDTIFADPVDPTPPSISQQINPQLNNNGWANTPVSLRWMIADSESLITSSNGCGAVDVATETTVDGATFTCTATSGGGTSQSSATIRYDATRPTINYSYNAQPNASGWYKNPVTANIVCSDSLSGVASCTNSFIFQDDTAGQTFQGSATDRAGNTASLTTGVVKLDKTAPAGSFTGSSLVIKLLLAQSLTGTVTDNLSGVSSVTLSTGSTVLSSQNGTINLTCTSDKKSCNWTVSSSRLPSGINNLTLTITDLAGNSYSIAKQYIIL